MSLVCEHCGKAYKRRGDLQRHIWVHFEVTPYRCEYCKMYFSQQPSLDRHLINHDVSAPYECVKCRNYKCGSPELLEVHRNDCVGKQNKCDECSQSFNSRSGLWSHKTTKHSNTTRFQCDDCKRRPFLSFATYEAHRKKRHPEVTSPKMRIVERHRRRSEEEMQAPPTHGPPGSLLVQEGLNPDAWDIFSLSPSMNRIPSTPEPQFDSPSPMPYREMSPKNFQESPIDNHVSSADLNLDGLCGCD